MTMGQWLVEKEREETREAHRPRVHVSGGDFLISNDAGHHRFSLPSIDRAHEGGRNPIDFCVYDAREKSEREREKERKPNIT